MHTERDRNLDSRTVVEKQTKGLQSGGRVYCSTFWDARENEVCMGEGHGMRERGSS